MSNAYEQHCEVIARTVAEADGCLGGWFQRSSEWQPNLGPWPRRWITVAYAPARVKVVRGDKRRRRRR